MTVFGVSATLPLGESPLDGGLFMFPDDLPLCGHCGMDEITHDQTADHDFNAVGGGRTVPRHPEFCPPSKFRANARFIIVSCLVLWAAIITAVFWN